MTEQALESAQSKLWSEAKKWNSLQSHRGTTLLWECSVASESLQWQQSLQTADGTSLSVKELPHQDSPDTI